MSALGNKTMSSAAPPHQRREKSSAADTHRTRMRIRRQLQRLVLFNIVSKPRPSTVSGLQCFVTGISSRLISIPTALADARELFAKENTSACESKTDGWHLAAITDDIQMALPTFIPFHSSSFVFLTSSCCHTALGNKTQSSVAPPHQPGTAWNWKCMHRSRRPSRRQLQRFVLFNIVLEPRPSSVLGLQCFVTDISSQSITIPTALTDARKLFAKKNASACESKADGRHLAAITDGMQMALLTFLLLHAS